MSEKRQTNKEIREAVQACMKRPPSEGQLAELRGTFAMQERLSAIKERCENATKGPWYADIGNWQVESHCDDYYRAGVCTFSYSSRHDPNIPDSPVSEIYDGEFIAHAREDIPWLLEQLDSLRSSVELWKKRAEHMGDRGEECHDAFQTAKEALIALALHCKHPLYDANWGYWVREHVYETLEKLEEVPDNL